MAKIHWLKVWYRDEGVLGLLKAAWVSLIYLTPLFHILESVLGEKHHEKFIRAPRLGYWAKIDYPQTFNEYILHRKFETNNDSYVIVADRWRFRECVAERSREEPLKNGYCLTGGVDIIPFVELPGRKDETNDS